MKQKEISEIQVQLPVTKQIEGHSVVRGRSMFGDGGTMFFSRVSFILIPVIKRIFSLSDGIKERTFGRLM